MHRILGKKVHRCSDDGGTDAELWNKTYFCLGEII